MTEKRFTDFWVCETGEVGIDDYGKEKRFTSSEFEDFLNELNPAKQYADVEVCACVSTKSMFQLLLNAQDMLLSDNINKREILQLLTSVEHDVRMLNNKDTHIDRDLFD